MSLAKAPGVPTQLTPGTSSATSSSTPDLSARGAKLLAGTVGLRCRNFTYDVESVQLLLKLNDKRFGLTKPPSYIINTPNTPGRADWMWMWWPTPIKWQRTINCASMSPAGSGTCTA
ncbi:MAG: hypothetical protein NT047_03550 [Deltaproteobacteria bacterium]|nr:hypothetical protein [Deltaproteobacteria bacterium]